jgi:DNA-binding transcriptional ArsR family regulator
LTELDRVFHALADPTRRAILDRLSAGPLTVSGLAKPLENTLTAGGQHLQVLQESGLVRTDKVGREPTCRIDPAGFSLLEKWIGQHRLIWQRRLDRLGEVLDESDRTDREG